MDVSTLQGAGAAPGLATLQRAVQLLEVSTLQGPEGLSLDYFEIFAEYALKKIYGRYACRVCAKKGLRMLSVR